MLKQRVITAIVLLAVLLPALFAHVAWPFDVLLIVALAAGAWEWGRLNGLVGGAAIGFGVLLAVVCGVSLAVGWDQDAPRVAWFIATLVWVLGGAWAIRVGPQGWPKISQGVRLGLGLVALWVAWLALANAKAIGINFLLSVFCLAWAADIGAYFGGRTFGHRKLAPAISPGKSWEGVWSGMICTLLLSLGWILIDRFNPVDSASVYTRLFERFGPAGLIATVLFLDAMSVVGDLVESSVKRSAGAKDSSSLLPGHGGVLDRVDALLPLFPLALALVSV